jgi:hypothetical protein
MVKAVNILAKEKKESYTPSDDMGKNPESRVSAEIKMEMAPWLYDSKKSVINKFGLSKKEQENLMIELNGAINHLTQIVLKRIYGFKIKRNKNANLADPTQITDFEFLAKTDKGLSREQVYAINTQVAVNRQIRGTVQAWITMSLMPFFQYPKKSWYAVFADIYKNADPKTIRSKNVYRNIMKHHAKNMGTTFANTSILDYIASFRITPKTKPVSKPKKKPSQKKLPPGKS